MTVEIFRFDPYRIDFEARVVGRERSWVALDQTCFSPGEGAGSAGDVGCIAGIEVVTARRRDRRRLEHLMASLADDEGPVPGDKVHGAIDWHRRYLSMRLHTAHHLADVGLRHTHAVGGLTFCSAPDGKPIITLVLEHGSFDPAAINGWLSDVVAEDLPMLTESDSDGTSAAIWHLDGLGHRQCDGIHVRSTGEIGPVVLHKVREGGARIDLSLEVADVHQSGGST